MITDHPDTLTDYFALKQIRRGSKQAIEDKAIEAYHKAIDEGRGKEEAEKRYFSFFNNVKMEPVQIPWKATKDGLPEKPGLEQYEQVACLVITMFDHFTILTWNCEHGCWDDDDGDDYACDALDVKYYIPLSQLSNPQP